MSSLRAIVAMVVAAGTLLAAGGASAATIEDSATEGPSSEEFILYRAEPGERNRLTITDSKEGIVLIDHGARMRDSGSGFGTCKYSRDRHRAVCALFPEAEQYIIELGDHDDVVRFKGVNRSRLGLAPLTAVSDAARLGDYYEDVEEVFTEHASIFGGSGNDVLRGTWHADFLDGGKGRDVVDGGSGEDRLVDAPDGARDRLFGGRGIDTIDGMGAGPLNIDLAGRAFVAGSESDSLNSFERARGGSGDDTLSGTNGPDGLFGDLGSDVLNGRRGNDYLGGDLEEPQTGSRGEPGQDVLIGGVGRDILDGREKTYTPTDQLNCGDDRDRIVARQDDLADPSCELSETGRFSGDLYFSQFFDTPPLSSVWPVARGADGAPTYAIGCPRGYDAPVDCTGKVQLERPPLAGEPETTPEVLGSGEFSIPGGARRRVTVVLNAAGKAAMAVPGARISVRVLIDPNRDFGWQQVLGP